MEWKGTGTPELFDVHLNKVLVHFYTAAGKPNEEKYRGTARKLRQSTDILGHCLSLNALI